MGARARAPDPRFAALIGRRTGVRKAALVAAARALFAVPALVAAALVLFAVPALASTGDPPRIESITFEGNRHLSAGRLRDAMRLRQRSWTRPFSTPRYAGADFLAADLHAVVARYAESGYPFARILEATVAIDASGDAARIRIALEEGPRVRLSRLVLRGLPADWEREVRERSTLARGEPLSFPEVLGERDRVASWLSDRGHPLSRADLTLIYAGDSAEVRLDVDPGRLVRVDSIRIEGLRRTREEVVRRELTLRPGASLLGRRVLESRQRLLDTGLFQRVRIVPEFGDSAEPRAQLRVLLEERRSGWYGAGAGYSSSDRLRFVSEWGLRNLGGTGRRIGLTGSLYYSLDPKFRGGGVSFREGLIQFDALEPWLWNSRTRLFVSPYLRWLQEAEYHQRILGYNLTARRELNRWVRLSLGLESKHVRTTERLVLPRYTTRLVNLNAIEDRRDNLFDPQRGRLLQGVAEYAGGILAGTNRFARYTGTWQGYSRPEPGWVLAGRVKLGEIRPIGEGPGAEAAEGRIRLRRIPSEERFRLGGGNTIRGYNEAVVGLRDATGTALGGLSLLLVNLEIRFPIVSIVSGGLFLDAGNVWADPGELKLSRFRDGLQQQEYDPRNVAYGIGGGLRIATPVGPFRFDYGFKVGSGRAPGDPGGVLHAALGQAF